MARRKMIEVEYTLDTGAVFTDYMQSKSVGKTLRKLQQRIGKENYIELGPVSIETDGIVWIKCKEMEIN